MHIITVISVHRMLYHLKNLKNTRPLELSSNFKQHLILILKDKIEYTVSNNLLPMLCFSHLSIDIHTCTYYVCVLNI